MSVESKDRGQARRWIAGGAALMVVGAIVFYFIARFEIPVPGQAGIFLFLTPLGLGLFVYGLGLAWRGRSKPGE
ncbi:hypothetical protein HD599_000025 [Conyzicola lurida]|uniref:Uncharacterized protein n=1 Tax=Conyzicola lurida TaxID=1172621 RepID=A0A841AI81_9MICO|nr:hypothetical protein [Conyzicola lurida]MBB5841702.1 hypothetical protein [Conyzicola lurida]